MTQKVQVGLTNELVKNKDIKECNIIQHGDNNTQIAHVDNYHTSNIIINQVSSNSQNRRVILNKITLNHEHYNLFVIGDEQYNGTYFYVPKNRALTESISPEIKNKYSSLSNDAINEIKSFPAIFCSENHNNAKTDQDQEAIIGTISDIEIRKNEIKIGFNVIISVPQLEIINMSNSLMIEGTEFYTELCRTHWTIKNVNLVKILKAKGFCPYQLS